MAAIDVAVAYWEGKKKASRTGARMRCLEIELAKADAPDMRNFDVT